MFALAQAGLAEKRRACHLDPLWSSEFHCRHGWRNRLDRLQFTIAMFGKSRSTEAYAENYLTE
jgi:hypothetical protein